jgi:VanZ family protein
MSKIKVFFKRWTFAMVMMCVIFAFSSIPSSEMPNFLWADVLVKKSGHVIVFSLLALSFCYGLGWKREKLWLAWGMTFLYAILDEFHQSFVPGRSAWWMDVVIDSVAAALALWAATRWRAGINKSG